MRGREGARGDESREKAEEQKKKLEQSPVCSTEKTRENTHFSLIFNDFYAVISITKGRQRLFALIHFTLFQGVSDEETCYSLHRVV
jgi:hypothetical protein